MAGGSKQDAMDAIHYVAPVGQKEAYQLKQPLMELNGAAQSAIAEFGKVVRLRNSTAAETKRVSEKAEKCLAFI